MIKLGVLLALMALVHSVPVGLAPTESDITNRCSDENDITSEARQTIRSRIMNEKELTSNEQCYIKCIVQATHVMDDASNFTPREGVRFTAVQAGVEPSEDLIDFSENMFRNCGFPNTENLCERAVQIIFCMDTVIKNEEINN